MTQHNTSVDAAAMLARSVQWLRRMRDEDHLDDGDYEELDAFINVACRLSAPAPTPGGDRNAAIEALKHCRASGCTSAITAMSALTRPTPTAAEPITSSYDCEACLQPIKEGDAYHPDDINGAAVHAACVGSDRNAFTDEDGNPIADDAPIPPPSIWEAAEPEGGEQPVAWRWRWADNPTVWHGVADEIL